jgi:hypothetical protein
VVNPSDLELNVSRRTHVRVKWLIAGVAATVVVLGFIFLGPRILLPFAFSEQEDRIQAQAESALVSRTEVLATDIESAAGAQVEAEELESLLIRYLGGSILDRPASEGQYRINVVGDSAEVDLFASANATGSPTFSTPVGLFVCFRATITATSPALFIGIPCPDRVIADAALSEEYAEVEYEALTSGE